ncbi:hypothetical protein [Streptomyces albidoflavus]|uniref:hypothetical protein n=1 Tax=Streptomyces albidoflavus TaxID=1886 RepID=UPI0033F587C4
MTQHDTNQQVYRLSAEHHDWSDVDDLVPGLPSVPQELQPVFPTREDADVDDLAISRRDGGAVVFYEDSLAVEATPQEVDSWLAAYADVERAQERFRDRLRAAKAAYEAAAVASLKELAESTAKWTPVATELEARSAALATKVASQRDDEARREKAEEEQKQLRLTALYGPQAIHLAKPSWSWSVRGKPGIARVHMYNCRFVKVSIESSFCRANEAWDLLTHQDRWLDRPVAHPVQVKFCGACRPWTLFEEHVKDFPRPRSTSSGGFLGPVPLVDIPDSWAS